MSRRPASLGDLGERAILADVLAPRYRDVTGFGDDCAVLGLPTGAGELVATTDSCPAPLVAQLGDIDPYHAGWLLVTINLSDLAAAGASPLGLVVNYTLPADTPVADFRRLLAGVDDCAAEHQTRVVGGDLRDGPTQLSATAVGQCAQGCRLGRRGAAVGDQLLLVGSPGYLWAEALLAEGRVTLPPDDAALLAKRARRPKAQLVAGRLLAEAGFGRAAMDVSDGLFASVRALCEVNGVGARMTGDVRLDPVPAAVCRQAGVRPFDLAATWGDWCLLVAVRPRDVEMAQAKLAANSCTSQVVGELVADNEIMLDTVPWQGMAQERFSTRSWHGGDLAGWLAAMLPTDSGRR
ncbi:MAG TPA: thiamine-phosphate kinase [Pseudonocardiaceae bacterium]|jgi:thiamine-monophosphate kinase|nr:thiamine-phosphate kinase [Pseudonocardiaceae bacterium]